MLTRTLQDPRLTGVIITHVEMADDLRRAKVYIRLLEEGASSSRNGALKGLRHASGLIRREVTRRIGLRYAPDLQFSYDEQYDQILRIEQLMTEIENE